MTYEENPTGLRAPGAHQKIEKAVETTLLFITM